MFTDSLSRLVRTPPGFKERLHGERMHSRNACGLINSISGGKDLATSFPCGAGKIPWKHADRSAHKPPRTCDCKRVVVPDVVQHLLGESFAQQEMHLDPKSHGGCGIQKTPRLGSEICHRASCKHKHRESNLFLNKAVKIHYTSGLGTVLTAYNRAAPGLIPVYASKFGA